jgi:hypothetical protein
LDGGGACPPHQSWGKAQRQNKEIEPMKHIGHPMQPMELIYACTQFELDAVCRIINIVPFPARVPTSHGKLHQAQHTHVLDHDALADTLASWNL